MPDSFSLQRPRTKPKKPGKIEFNLLPKEPKRPPQSATNHRLKPKLEFKNVFKRNERPNIALDQPESSVPVPYITHRFPHFTQDMTQSAEHLAPFVSVPVAQTYPYAPYSSGEPSVTLRRTMESTSDLLHVQWLVN